MNEKLSFTVENADIIDENPDSNFAIMALDFFASGENLHDMYVSEETLMKTADTIKNCPLVWKYDKTLDDIYTHDKDEVPCGFVPETSAVQTKKLEDGRTMLSIVAYVWKRYTGELLSFFRRDGGKKPVSVEMSVFEKKLMASGLTELLQFRYECVTILGSFITPAIPSAQAQVLSFSEIKQAYIQDFKKEFSDKTKEELVTFPYTSLEDINPALKGITPSITVAQANEISRQADAIGSDKEKSGWAIAISSFKKTHDVKDGKWVKKNSEKMEMNMDKEKITEETSAEISVETEQPASEQQVDTPVQEEVATIEEHAAETPSDKDENKNNEEKKDEDEKEDKKVFAFPENMSLEKMEELFAGNEDENILMAKAEFAKGQDADPAIVMSGMFAVLCKLTESVNSLTESTKVLTQENEELEKFKADLEVSQRNFEVEKTLRELSERVILPNEAKEEMVKEAENYSLSDIDKWKTYCKAKSFDFAVKQTGEEDSERVALPFTEDALSKKDDLWASLQS